MQREEDNAVDSYEKTTTAPTTLTLTRAIVIIPYRRVFFPFAVSIIRFKFMLYPLLASPKARDIQDTTAV